ncbi:unnamed protein product [Protopolystoma xenopodis]|uniref:Uncharacterized protein n=1 Tax=Protopolystoma xenopodis TaxID=117903 RepID=A0A448WRD8_9PLAT|nr:unnamed protein product [Protopolystoma xenopodis]
MPFSGCSSTSGSSGANNTASGILAVTTGSSINPNAGCSSSGTYSRLLLSAPPSTFTSSCGESNINTGESETGEARGLVAGTLRSAEAVSAAAVSVSGAIISPEASLSAVRLRRRERQLILQQKQIHPSSVSAVLSTPSAPVTSPDLQADEKVNFELALI